MAQRLFLVDVFAEKPYSGNPLAVVVSNEWLDVERMQQVAQEINFSETTFVMPVAEADGGYRVRIFTPAREIAFAGHPILGTAWVLREFVTPGRPAQLHLNLPVGRIPVTFEVGTETQEVAWFTAPTSRMEGTWPAERVASSLGIPLEDIDLGSPVQQVSSGVSVLIVPLRSLDGLRRCAVDSSAMLRLAAGGMPTLVYLYTREVHHRQNDLCARFFFEAHGAREDPATGNGAAFLGAYLMEHGLRPAAGFSLRIEQGYELRRPSLVLLRARRQEGKVEVLVGGVVLLTARGELV